MKKKNSISLPEPPVIKENNRKLSTGSKGSRRGSANTPIPIILVSPTKMEEEESSNSKEKEEKKLSTVPKLTIAQDSVQLHRSGSNLSSGSNDIEGSSSKSSDSEEKEEKETLNAKERKDASTKEENQSNSNANSAVPSYMKPLQRKNSSTRGSPKSSALASPRSMKMGNIPSTFGAPPSSNPKYGSLRVKNSPSMVESSFNSTSVNNSPPPPSSPPSIRAINSPSFPSSNASDSPSALLSSSPTRNTVSLGKKAGNLTAADMAMLKLSNSPGPISINTWASVNSPRVESATVSSPRKPHVSTPRSVGSSRLTVNTASSSSLQNVQSAAVLASSEAAQPSSPKVRPTTPKSSTTNSLKENAASAALKQQLVKYRDAIVALTEELEKKESGITELNNLCTKLNGELNRNQEHNRQLEKHIVTICTLHLQKYKGNLPASPSELPPFLSDKLNEESEKKDDEEKGEKKEDEKNGETSEEEEEEDSLSEFRGSTSGEETLEERVLKRERQFYQLKNRYIQTLSSLFPKIRQFEESLEAARDDAYRAHRAYESSQKEVATLKAELARLKR
eukprot:TRINITY_DN7400_c0_g1_i1.p1 TRINITY_DN7400_c0_g1~~TRINITY_DN7400_c0_g1_i1.p1  ORF type:complete len:565 (+),score=235.54 TRINITY_DN7400_c0_g1_i1:142-1836(+)